MYSTHCAFVAELRTGSPQSQGWRKKFPASKEVKLSIKLSSAFYSFSKSNFICIFQIRTDRKSESNS